MSTASLMTGGRLGGASLAMRFSMRSVVAVMRRGVDPPRPVRAGASRRNGVT